MIKIEWINRRKFRVEVRSFVDAVGKHHDKDCNRLQALKKQHNYNNVKSDRYWVTVSNIAPGHCHSSSLSCTWYNLHPSTSCCSVISFPSPSPPLSPSGQEKLFCLPEGLLSNTRWPRHSGLICVPVCAYPNGSTTDRPNPAQHCVCGIWQFFSTLSFGKHTLGWEGMHGASVSMRWCKRGETLESSQLNRNTAGVLKVLKEVQSLGAERKVIKEHSASGYMTDNKSVSRGRTIAHIDE